MDGFGTFKLTNFDSSIIMNKGIIGSSDNTPYSRNSIFSDPLEDDYNDYETKTKDKNHQLLNGKTNIFIAPELLDPQQYTSVMESNKLFEKADIWSLGCLLLFLLYDGILPITPLKLPVTAFDESVN